MLGISTIVGAVFGVITWFIQNFASGILVFFGTWTLVTALQAFRVIKRAPPRPTTPEEPEPESAALQAPPTSSVLSSHPPVQDHEVPQLLATRRVQGRSFQIEQFVRHRAFTLLRDVHLQINQMRFVDCYIYGPAIVVPLRGIVGGRTFVDCTWDEEPWQRWRAPYAAGYYVGAITLEDCVFRNCTLGASDLLWTRTNMTRRWGSSRTRSPRCAPRLRPSRLGPEATGQPPTG